MRKILLAAVLAAGVSFGASAAEKLKVGFIYLGPIGDLGWTYQHDLGRLAMASASCGRSALNSCTKASKRSCCCRLFAPGGRVASFLRVRCMRS